MKSLPWSALDGKCDIIDGKCTSFKGIFAYRLNGWTSDYTHVKMGNFYKRYHPVQLMVSLSYKRLQYKYRRQEAKLNAMKNDLELLVKRFQEKVDMVNNLRLENEKLTNQSQHKHYLEKLISATILTDEDWISFRAVFEKVHPGFISQQKVLFPKLTSADIRLLALEKLGLTAQEMARMLGVNKNTIYQTKKRLRKRKDVVNVDYILSSD